ncbi:unnamed protein product [Tilletia controversa]|uniref:Major facilitator superfamily (MFS) profile domain-containing protein n=1 Tax=Tilletia controversa TaxID=13291 RepID=A0A8X7ST26_9BASI|nr:hypothetical protein CF328_g7659 [Tilletia controversa]KAE8238991.1 hypothetical protein A4X06_0g8549 [Tilletia controversa]CAD6920454.1 unnamed protein product [Tilletia controversa]CAD6942035.1 unnamed protein product [Tilletia controversa]CAD6960056.1 unnamed protein product [Tilletia controversa]
MSLDDADSIAPTHVGDPTQDEGKPSVDHDVEKRSIKDVADPAHLTLRILPWRRRVEPFERILSHDYAGSGTEDDPYVVSWLNEDREDPMNSSDFYKWFVTVIVSLVTLAVGIGSSAYSGAIEKIGLEFGGTEVQLTLGVSLWVLGFALGPLVWAPCSESYGRRNTLLFTYSFLTLWSGLCICAPNLTALLIFRFLAGAFGSSPLTNSGGTIADIFPAAQRGLGMAIFCAAPFLGPSLGPIIGGFLAITEGWKAVMIFLTVLAGGLLLLAFLCLPETYSPVLLRARCERLEKATGKKYIAVMDKGKDTRFASILKVNLTRPWQLIAYEPIVMILSLYIAIIYGVLYSFFGAFPIVFQLGRGWNAGVGGLAFLGILVGMIAALAWIILYDNPRYVGLIKKEVTGIVPPEARLQGSQIGGILIVIGLASFAAVDAASVHFMIPIIASAPFGAGMVLVFLSITNYLVDSYLLYASSVLAANSIIRSLFGMAFPLFTPAMYDSLGIHGAPALAAGLAALCVPFPFLLYKYGPAIRTRCRYAAEAAKLLDQIIAARKAAAAAAAALKMKQAA